MKIILIMLAMLLPGPVAMAGDDAGSDADRQAELDRQCEAAREEKLAPIRAEIYDECVNKQGKEPEYCRRYADGYDGTRIGGAPRFYELPECVAAFEYSKSTKR